MQNSEFLNLKFEEFDFQISPKKEKIEIDIEKYKKPNSVVLFNGEIVFSSLNDFDVFTKINSKEINNYKNENSDSFFSSVNKRNLNSVFNLKTTAKTPQNQTIFVFNIFYGQVCHLSNYSLDLPVNVVETIISVGNSKLNFFMRNNLNSVFSYSLIENLAGDNNFVGLDVEVSNKAQFEMVNLSVNSQRTIEAFNVSLNCENSKAKIDTLTFASKNDFVSKFVNVIHNSKATTSKINNIAFVNDFATINIAGKNQILKGKSKSDADQKTRIINLTDKAKSQANPVLEIDEFDVKASHNATVGKIDDEIMYYLMSRGLEKKEAEELVVLGLSQSILEKIPMQNDLIKLIKGKI